MTTPQQPSSFVFYDPSGNRWARFWRLAKTLALVFVLITVVLIIAAISLPQLPVLGLLSVAPVNPMEGPN